MPQTSSLPPPAPTWLARSQAFLLRPPVLVAAYAVLTVLLTAQHYFKGSYNNYLIFVKPFFNLLAEKNLYLEYPAYYYDTYKYSPTFALCMGPLAVLPTWLGLLLWNGLNTAVFVTAVLRLFPNDARRQGLLLLFLLIDTLTALHNVQANCLLAGLMLWTYLHLEARRPALAGLCLALAAFIKVYGIGVGLLFLFYPGFWRNVAWAAAWGVALALAPLLVVSAPALTMIYRGWFDIVRASATGIQLSLLGVLQSWFGLDMRYKGIVQGLGLALLALPALLHRRAWPDAGFRRTYLASVLVFVVIFNQMGESPTYVIAVTGFGLWFVGHGHRTPLGWPLFWFVLTFTTLSATDLLPGSLRRAYFDVYKLKAVPMVVAWAVVQWELLRFKGVGMRE